jgi:ABC-type multidrug transport system fused ATPase/permease subunit
LARHLRPAIASRLRSLRRFSDYRRWFVGYTAVSLVSAQCEAAAIIVLIALAKAVAGSESNFVGSVGPFTLNVSTAQLGLVAGAGVLAALLLNLFLAWSRSRVMASWELSQRIAVIDDYWRADYATQASERLGTLGTLALYTSRGGAALGSIAVALNAGLTMAVLLGGAFLLDVRAALVAIATVIGLSLVLRPWIVRTKRYAQTWSTMSVEYNQELTEATRVARDVRVYWAHDAIARELHRTSEKMAVARQHSAFLAGAMSPAYQYLGMLLIVGALASANHLFSVDVAVIGGVALLLVRCLAYGQQMQFSLQVLADAGPYLDHLDTMRETYASHPQVDGTVQLEDVKTLHFEDVTFSYDGEVDALSHLTATFRRGEIVGIVGPSGSGKSTFTQLLLRLREPTMGRILVDGIDASELTLASWYWHVSLVPQDPRLLHGTIFDNIAFFDPRIGEDVVERAARAAGIHEVITGLRDGYNTTVGPAFRDLSGGQIQRIGIARALARSADVLVLDEPTSALDVHSEAKIQDALASLRDSALVIVIAHRLSTLSICDRILVLNNGAIETIGTLEAVSQSSDFFRRAMDAGTLDIGTPQP